MAKKGKNTGKEIEVDVMLSRSEEFIDKNKKTLMVATVAIIVLVGGFLAYHYGYQIPQEKKAVAAIYKGEHFFTKDSFNLALNGNGADYIGFEEISKKYRGTSTGNIAKAYAGVCLYRTGNYAEAEKFLKSFKATEKNVSPTVLGLVGDCYVQLDKPQEGVSYFEKAANLANNDLISPVYLKKAATVYESLNQYDAAIKAYTTIKEKYSASVEASDIDKFITRAQLLSKN